MRHQYSIAYTNVSISQRNNDGSDDLKGNNFFALSLKKYVYLCELVLKLLLISSIALEFLKHGGGGDDKFDNLRFPTLVKNCNAPRNLRK